MKQICGKCKEEVSYIKWLYVKHEFIGAYCEACYDVVVNGLQQEENHQREQKAEKNRIAQSTLMKKRRESWVCHLCGKKGMPKKTLLDYSVEGPNYEEYCNRLMCEKCLEKFRTYLDK